MGGVLLLALVMLPLPGRATERFGMGTATMASSGTLDQAGDQRGAAQERPEVPQIRPLPRPLPVPPPALGTGAPGLLSEMRCPERALSPPLVTSPAYSSGAYSLGAPTLGIGPGTGSALYGQTFGENYGAGPGSVTEQSNAILGRNCETLSGE